MIFRLNRYQVCIWGLKGVAITAVVLGPLDRVSVQMGSEIIGKRARFLSFGI